MSYKFEVGKDLIINNIVEKIEQKMTGKQAQLCAEFVRQFYGTIAMDDLMTWDIEDLYGAAINFWSLIQYRAPDETKIRIYNPDFERHGWQTTHTVVEVITKDMPFLVDSLRIVINRMALVSHLIIHMGGLWVRRGKNNEITDIFPRGSDGEKDVICEAPIFIEIDRQTDPKILEELHLNFERALEDTKAVVEDWMPMRHKVREAISELDNIPHALDSDEVEETKAFLNWIEDHHFTFLGIRDYELVHKGSETLLQPLPKTGLGVLRPEMSNPSARSVSSMSPEARELTLSPRILVMSKTNTEATVHRQALTDYIGVKRFNKKGEVIGERRIIGLYTSAAYNTNPKHIPFLRHKVAQVMKNSHLNPRSHAGKVLLNILETLPRDDLIQGNEDELLEIAMGIYYMQDRRRIRMFARTDVYRRFVSCLVYVPKDQYNSQLRESMQQILAEAFHSHEITFSTLFNESLLARIHFIVRTNPADLTVWDFKEIERKLIDVGRSWSDELKHFLVEAYGEEKSNRLYTKYKAAFPTGYSDSFSSRTAVYDIKHIEELSAENPLLINFYKPMDEIAEQFHLKIYQQGEMIALSEVLPIVERLGMKAISESPYALKSAAGKKTWINDFALEYTRSTQFEIDEIKDLFQNAFCSIWFGKAENDGFNQLVLAAGLNWHQVTVLRAYAKYFKQIGFTFSQEYIETALANNASIAKKLVKLFETRFNPIADSDREALLQQQVDAILVALDDVVNLDEDKIIRQYVHVISATIRTNYYQLDDKSHHKPYLSFKLNSKAIPGLPKPYPLFEIFVYSPIFEGIHLRFGRVARGGLRWSDRPQDFRTETLGLAKAQQVKNAVIVPSGAKGGFVAKRLPVNGSREEIMAEGIKCYQLFIRGLLDITDNYEGTTVVKPKDVVAYDEEDPYLVVAADKGTATFSDFANAISVEYGFWLGDAFASGGSTGYDHKKMGITAKGAWESVKRHFYELGIDIRQNDFTVVGIGDMAGDVFGNGMLLSKHIKLVAAFNHLHIFIDPNPDPDISYQERLRLFNLPRSSWMDYNKTLISKGGGVFHRNAKSIVLTPEIKALLDIKQMAIEPNELIRLILRAKVDLLWSAGIGTFVKAQSENNADVGDRTNDALRINARQLRCKVVGEGGNLGLTQLARVEYSLNGGLIYTDFIDNSGGVNCSDKEVNIKILLNAIVNAGDLTEKQRNELLGEMTEEVSQLVLNDNYAQPRAISIAATQAFRGIDLHIRYLNYLEKIGKLDRSLEFLPNEKILQERKLMGKGLTRPSISVLLCYTKTILKEQILDSNAPEDPFLKVFLISSFPKPLQQRYSRQMQSHPLKREIIATKLSNLIINEMGFTFVYRLQDETGAPVSAIVRAYMISRSILTLETYWKAIEALEPDVTAEKQIECWQFYIRLLRRVTHWFLRNQRMRLDIHKAVKLYAPGIQELKRSIPSYLGEIGQKQYEEKYQYYLQWGLPEELAREMTVSNWMFTAMDILDVSQQLNIEVSKVVQVYFAIDDFLNLSWIRMQIIAHPTENHWEALSREALRDDLDWQQRQLAAGIISFDAKKEDFLESFNTWAESHKHLIDRWQNLLDELRATQVQNFTMFFVACRELLDLTQTTMQMVEKEDLIEA